MNGPPSLRERAGVRGNCVGSWGDKEWENGEVETAVIGPILFVLVEINVAFDDAAGSL